jgi:TonB family protein
MKTSLLCIVAAALLFAFAACKSSKNTVRDEDISVPADSVASADIEIFIDGFDDLPLFNGKTADKDFFDYVYKNLRCPLPECDVFGRVFVEFVIEKDGSVSNAVVVRGLHPALDAEALRVIRSSSGMWTPGTQFGKPVKMKYTFPVNYQLKAPPVE